MIKEEKIIQILKEIWNGTEELFQKNRIKDIPFSGGVLDNKTYRERKYDLLYYRICPLDTHFFNCSEFERGWWDNSTCITCESCMYCYCPHNYGICKKGHHLMYYIFLQKIFRFFAETLRRGFNYTTDQIKKHLY